MPRLPDTRDPASPPAASAAASRLRSLSIVGATLGLALFLAVALVPSLLYGGQSGFRLAGGLLGTPVAASPLVSTVIVLGVVLSAVAGASLFAVIGALGGAGLGILTRASGRGGPGRPTAP